MKNVLVFGTFDLLHPGHKFVLSEAMRRGRVTVIVARTENVKRIKGRAPEQSEEERLAALRTFSPDLTVQLGTDHDFLWPVRVCKPDLILLGYDQKLPPGVAEANLAPAKVERLPAHEPHRFKSTLLRKEERSTM